MPRCATFLKKALRALVAGPVTIAALLFIAVGVAALLLAAGPNRLPEWLAPVSDVCWAKSAFASGMKHAADGSLRPMDVENWIAHMGPAADCALAVAGCSPDSWCGSELQPKLQIATSKLTAFVIVTPEAGWLFAGAWVLISLTFVLRLLCTCRSGKSGGQSRAGEAVGEAAPRSTTLAAHIHNQQALVTAENTKKPSMRRMDSPGKPRKPLAETQVAVTAEQVSDDKKPDLRQKELSDLRQKGLVNKILSK